ncbi:cholesterol 7-desaturase nvd-like [Gigantopelta aegis]|uniref:cholesterol 7-desaturase nvd-like n=1 Tax=Gigantopelta aegis TaxID=1735272 RepID=UPI001B88E6CB|nr:cholesterol 7-desaturase nvd-like [Gigantopelta aegis]
MMDSLRTFNVSLSPIPVTLFELVFVAVCTVFIYLLYAVLFQPTNRVRKLEDVGYISDQSSSKKEVADSTQRRRVVGEIPPVYPNGWFGLFESFQLKKAEAKYINVLGLHLAVFRDENGNVHALDAYCPHLGANLAVGGKVTGSCLSCPFHGWRFRGEDGKCVHIPYNETVPEFAKVKSWPVMEVNEWVYLWHHAEGEEPSWKPPEMLRLSKGEWTYRGRTEHMINAHIQEIPENGADLAHLDCVHVSFIGSGTDLRYIWSKAWSFVKHNWTAKWESFDPPEGHVGQLSLTHAIKVFGMSFPLLDLSVKAKQIGPGFVYLDIEGVFGKGVIIHNVLPVGPLMQKVVHNIYVERKMPTFIAKFYMLGEAIQVERDIMIWNNKRYVNKPVFVKSREDTFINRHRRWYSQFYSENSPRLTSEKNKTLEW